MTLGRWRGSPNRRRLRVRSLRPGEPLNAKYFVYCQTNLSPTRREKISSASTGWMSCLLLSRAFLSPESISLTPCTNAPILPGQWHR